MTDINTNKHGSGLFHNSGELHCEEVTSALRIHLADNVSGLGGIETSSISCSYYLRRHAVFVKGKFI